MVPPWMNRSRRNVMGDLQVVLEVNLQAGLEADLQVGLEGDQESCREIFPSLLKACQPVYRCSHVITLHTCDVLTGLLTRQKRTKRCKYFHFIHMFTPRQIAPNMFNRHCLHLMICPLHFSLMMLICHSTLMAQIYILLVTR